MPNLELNLQQELLQSFESYRFIEQEENVLSLLQKKEITPKQAQERLGLNSEKLEQLISEFNAKRKKQEDYVLVLLKHKDIDLERACELLNINMEELVELISEYGVDKFQLNSFGLTAKDRTYISRQARQLDRMKTQLTDEYLDKWVWFENGQVLDSDENHQALLDRVSEKVGDRVVFIEKIDRETTN